MSPVLAVIVGGNRILPEAQDVACFGWENDILETHELSTQVPGSNHLAHRCERRTENAGTRIAQTLIALHANNTEPNLHTLGRNAARSCTSKSTLKMILKSMLLPGYGQSAIKTR